MIIADTMLYKERMRYDLYDVCKDKKLEINSKKVTFEAASCNNYTFLR